MYCRDCSKKALPTAREAIIALSRAVSGRSMGDNRRECRFYPCPTGNGFHLTSTPADHADRTRYVLLSSMVVKQYSSVLSRV